MLRYCYLLSLFINLSFCYEYSSHVNPSKRSFGKLKTDHRYQKENFQHRKHRKRHDYDMYDKEPVAEIDVASFINSAEDDSYNENDLYNLPYKKLRSGQHDSYFGGLTNDITNNNEDYADIEAENLQETSHNNINYPFSKDKVINDKITNEFHKGQDNLDDNLNNQKKKHYKEKKRILKHLKLPFFSHNKSTIAKVKNDKKRKNYSFHNLRKGNVLWKGSNELLLKHDMSRDNLNLGKHDKIKKRSYIERICPACRRKFIVSKSVRSQTERNNILKNIYDRTPQNYEENLDKDHKPLNKDDIDAIIQTSNEKGTFEDYWSDRRKREGDDRNIERQKELEYLEKRVESVTANNPSYNKNKM